jgi:hypothetical protein
VALVPATGDLSRLAGLVPEPHDAFNVGYVGAVDFKKLHPEFVPMCARVAVPEARFLVCGAGGATAALAAQAAALGLGGRLELLGYVEELRSVLARLDVFGYPLCENPGAELSLQEAMFAGVPPVAFPRGGIRDAVADGRTGLLVGSCEEYSRAIEHLHRHPEERRRLGANARAHARERFGGERAARALLPLYQRLLAEPKRRRGYGEGVPAGRGEAPPGAARFADSLGSHGEPYRRSLAGGDPEELRAAEERIAACSPLERWGLGEWRAHYPADPHLARWYDLALARAGGRE